MLSLRLLAATCAAALLPIAPTFGDAPERIRGPVSG
jgi:hypothetical protein